MKKKIVTIMLAVAMMSSIVACESNNAVDNQRTESTESTKSDKKQKESDIESNKDNVIDNYAKYSIDDIDSMSEDELIMAAVDCIYREPETALAFLEPAADKDNKDALFLMGYIYGEVYRWQGRPDYEKALEYFEESDELIYSRLCIAEYYYHSAGYGAKNYSGEDLYEACEEAGDADALWDNIEENIEETPYASIAYYVVGRMYRYYNGATYNQELACDLYEKAAELGNPEAMYDYAYFVGSGVCRDKDIDKYTRLLEDSIELNNYYAMYELGRDYIEGKKVAQDIDRGVEMMTEAAENNCILAVKYLGYAYYDGEVVDYDEDKAEEYFAQWIDIDNRESGRLDAYMFLATDYYNGSKVKQDYVKAREYYQILFDAGIVGESYMLGKIYLEGLGIDADIDKGIEYYKIASETHEGEKASMVLAKLYYDGEIVDRDIDEAIKWYERAVECGSWAAAKKLGDIYSTGDGVPVDEQKAQEWYDIEEMLEPEC